MRWLFYLIISFPIVGCVTAQPAKNALQLKQSYRVEWIGERPLIDSSYLSITLDKNNRAFGMASCNYWSGNYILKGTTLTFSNITTTKKLCAPALMEQEKRFIAALPTIEHWDFSDIQQLRLWPKQGHPIKLWLENNT